MMECFFMQLDCFFGKQTNTILKGCAMQCEIKFANLNERFTKFDLLDDSGSTV